MIILGDEVPELPNWLRDADDQEGHDYELDTLRARDEQGLNKEWEDDEK